MRSFDYIGTWKEVMKSPSHFYSEMPKTGGYSDPIIFAAINVAVYSLFYLLFSPGAYDVGGFGPSIGFAVALIAPVVGVIALFLDATLLHIIQKVLGGKGTYEGTVRFVLYASAASSLLWIPLAGGIFGVYQLYLYVVGGRFVHKVSLERSALAMFLSILLIIVFAVLVSSSGFI
ncbi:YIP1 family protein [Methanosarcina sp. T3]|uniref:YIP1 family protein n=1 Tax=Methanosarcina sp. T3 TaxID=3439062 RepID=UPI003F8334A3